MCVPANHLFEFSGPGRENLNTCHEQYGGWRGGDPKISGWKLRIRFGALDNRRILSLKSGRVYFLPDNGKGEHLSCPLGNVPHKRYALKDPYL